MVGVCSVTSVQRFRNVVPLLVCCITAAAAFFSIIAGVGSDEAISNEQWGLASLAGVMSGALAFWQTRQQMHQRASAPIERSDSRNLPRANNLFQLPLDVEDFTGYAEMAAGLAENLLHPRSETALPVITLHGKGGVGKTTLAVHVAHRVRPHFPDGQIYINLHGEQPEPLAPADALARILNELGVNSDIIPPALEDQARLYRAQLAERRVLVVLDNARDERQVRPLLPGGAGCAVLVTSRARLAGLAGAHLYHVEEMPVPQGLDLLQKLIGTGRVSAELEAAQAVVDLCGGLPLAIRIAGARLSSRAQEPVSIFARRLRDEERRLDLLNAGDLGVRASFSISYNACAPDLRRIFRLLGTLGAHDFTPTVVTALCAVPAAEAEYHVDQLVDLGLLEAAGADPAGSYRFRFHDLLRVFAKERLTQEETQEARRDAAERLVKLQLSLVVNASVLLRQEGLDQPVEAPSEALRAIEADPVAWVRTERIANLAAVQTACEYEFCEVAWRLAAVIGRLPHWPTDWGTLIHAQRLGLNAALSENNQLGEARLRLNLGTLHRYRGDYADAVRELQTALQIFEGESDSLGTALTASALGDTYRYTGQLAEGIAQFEQALPEFQARNLRYSEARALNGLGDLCRGCGQWARAENAFTEAIRIFDDLNSPHAAACSRIRFGIVYRDRCHYARAEALFLEGLQVMRASGDRRWEGRAQRHLGVLWRSMGRTREAISALEEALSIFDSLSDQRGVAVVLRNLGDAHRRAGNLGKSVDLLTDALECFHALGDRRWEARTNISLADTHREADRFDVATGHLDTAAAIYTDLGYERGLARVTYCRGLVHQGKRNWPEALGAFTEARASFRGGNDHIWSARTLARIAEVRKAQGGRTWRQTLEEAKTECRQQGALSDADILMWLAAW